MSRPKGSPNKKFKYGVKVYFRSGREELHRFTSKAAANAFHNEVVKEYDENIRRSRGVFTLRKVRARSVPSHHGQLLA